MPAAFGVENRLEIRSAMPRSRLARRLAHGGSFLANFLTGPSSRQIDMMIFAAGNGNENGWELIAAVLTPLSSVSSAPYKAFGQLREPCASDGCTPRISATSAAARRVLFRPTGHRHAPR